MARIRHEDVRARRVRERKIWRTGIGVSLALHVLIFLFGPRGLVPLPSADVAGPATGDVRAADGTMTVIPLSSAPPAPIRRPALPIVSVDVAVPELNPTDPTAEFAVDLPEIRNAGAGSTSGRDPGDIQGAGLPGGTGSGNAGTAPEGRSRVIPPRPRGIILPPTNADLRGSRIEIWVFVDERGEVVADSTRLEPPTPDATFNEQLAGEASEWNFDPARENGTPVAAWFPYTVSME